MSPKKSLDNNHLNRILAQLQKDELINTNDVNFKISEILAGAINNNFLLQDSHLKCLLKVFHTPDFLPIDRERVFKLQEELAILGFAPRPLYMSDDKDIYVEEWVEGIKNSNTDPQKSVVLLAENLYNIHNAFVNTSILPLDQHWQSYLQQVQQQDQDLVIEYRRMQVLWSMYVKNNHFDFVLCHNDLHIDHVCEQSGKILDWEYAAIGCRYFDIASCIKINQLHDDAALSLCKQYALISNIDSSIVISRVDNMRKFVNFTYKLWSLSLGVENSPK